MLVDALASQRPVTDAAVLAHVEGCAACRAARDDYDAMWRQLGELAAPQPSADAHARFGQRLAGMRRGSTDGLRGRVRPWYATAWAATILIAALAGGGATIATKAIWLSGSNSSDPRNASSASSRRSRLTS